jgi:hypothetical protein
VALETALRKGKVMALVRVCDRCESDARIGMKTLAIGERIDGNTYVVRSDERAYFRQVDFCSECVVKLSAFIAGEYSDEDWEEKQEGESKKGKEDENLSAHSATCDCIVCVQA